MAFHQTLVFIFIFDSNRFFLVVIPHKWDTTRMASPPPTSSMPSSISTILNKPNTKTQLPTAQFKKKKRGKGEQGARLPLLSPDLGTGGLAIVVMPKGSAEGECWRPLREVTWRGGLALGWLLSGRQRRSEREAAITKLNGFGCGSGSKPATQ